jgi:Lrp/AsnC family transcriptional regulator, regulator for asnA, asnC and gidA
MTGATSPHLDSVDRKIVDFLREDGRMPYREIARRLDVSESKVRKRATRLLKSGWMRIMAMSNPLQLGVPVLATTYASVRPVAIDRVAAELARVDAVRYVAVGVGSHNLVVESLHTSNAELHGFIQNALGREEIIRSETIQVVEVKKRI